MIDETKAIEDMARATALALYPRPLEGLGAVFQEDCYKVAEAALSACPYKQAYLDLMDKQTGWLDISTAPLEHGSRFLGYHADVGMYVVDMFQGQVVYAWNQEPCHATHWQPLPPPPEMNNCDTKNHNVRENITMTDNTEQLADDIKRYRKGFNKSGATNKLITQLLQILRTKDELLQVIADRPNHDDFEAHVNNVVFLAGQSLAETKALRELEV